MRTIVFSLALFVAGASSVSASDFCDGFKRGYITGYKQAAGSGFDPFAPFCPFQPMKGYNDPASDFEHGYIIGLEQGYEEGN